MKSKNKKIDPNEVERLVQEQLTKKRAEKNKDREPKEKLRKRDYVRKGLYYCLVHPIIWPYHQFKRSRKHIKSSSSQLRLHLRDLKQNRDPWMEGAPDMTNFKQVLVHWGIHPKELYRVIKGMKIQLVFFALLGLWGVYNLTGTTTLSVLYGIPLTVVGLVIVITRLWRVQILKNRQFVYFKDWFLWGLFSWVGKETPFARELRLKKEDTYE